MAASSRFYPSAADRYPSRLRFPVTSRYLQESLNRGAQRIALSRPPANPDSAEWEMVVPKMARPPQITLPPPMTLQNSDNEPTQRLPVRRSLRALTVFWLLVLVLTVITMVLLKTRL